MAAGGFRVCIEAPPNNLQGRGDQGESYIIHVQFHACGTSRDHYRVDYEKLESTLLTEFLKGRNEGPLLEMLMKLTFNISPTQEANAFCENVLERGIFCLQRGYYFLGHSETQLRQKSCYLLRASHEEITHQQLAQFGDFLAERNVGKRARQIGMLFSPLNKTQPLVKTQYTIKPDIKRGFFRSYTFTDGCGFMSPEFSNEVQETLKIDYQPSVVQVRYRGIEGLLVLKDDLTNLKVQFHQSMEKFKSSDENMPESLSFVDVVDYSRPYENGYLDARMIMLLADRGVPAENLMGLQSAYHELLKGVCKETAVSEYFLRFKGEFGFLRNIRVNGIDDQMKKRLEFFRDQELVEMRKAAGQTRILVPHSRLVFAVCDPYGKLKPGECYFNPTIPEDETESFPGADQRLLVTRSPCYHSGDVRVLRLTDGKQGYENLRDCLVLPVNGPRPHAFECAGGNLGGNKFLVSWNEKFFPKVVERPCDYPLKKARGLRASLAYVVSNFMSSFCLSPRKRNKRGRQEMRQYFATFTDDLTERIDATYMRYAAVFGPSSKQCRRLGKLFYKAANLMEESSVLESEWLKLKEKEPSSSVSSGEPSQSPACNESSPLVINGERAPTVTTRQSVVRRFKRRKEQPPNASYVIQEKIEARSKALLSEYISVISE